MEGAMLSFAECGAPLRGLVAGNGIGDAGARALAEALRTNTTLRDLYLHGEWPSQPCTSAQTCTHARTHAHARARTHTCARGVWRRGCIILLGRGRMD
eukprot:scaffold4416_cov228-Prasinococcus_capsulatus_cf.AAC.5